MNNLHRFIAILLTIGCVSNLSASEQTIWEKGLNYIAIHDAQTFRKSNPATPQIAKAQITSALSTLTIEPKSTNGAISSLINSAEVTTLFTETEVEVLSNSIFSTLHALEDHQILVFSVSDRRTTFLGLGSETLHSSGSVYVDGKDLYLLLAEAQVDIQKKYIRAGNSVNNSRFATASELRGFRLPTGDFSSQPNHDWQFQLSDNMLSVNDRKDWIKIDLNNQPNQPKVVSHDKSNLTFNVPIVESTNKEANQQPSSELETHLNTLKQLYLNGQIPEQIYLQKVKAVIDEI